MAKLSVRHLRGTGAWVRVALQTAVRFFQLVPPAAHRRRLSNTSAHRRPGVTVRTFPQAALAAGRWLALIFCFAALAGAYPRDVSVRLFRRTPVSEALITPAGATARLQLCPTCVSRRVAGPLRVRAQRGRLQVGETYSRAGYARFEGEFQVEIPGGHKIRVPGSLEFRTAGRHLSLTLRTDIEDYIADVLAGEAGNFVSDEALKAMAVCARTYALRQLGQHRREGYDFCDTTHCQQLRLSAAGKRLRAACEDTEGELLWHEGRPVRAFYHRHCGGATEAAKDIWPQSRASYLETRPDSFCIEADPDSWQATVNKEQFLNAFRKAGIRFPPGANPVEILAESASGRVRKLRLGETEWYSSRIRLEFGKVLGSGFLRSTRFRIIDEGDSLVFTGSGSGHGVGLCQIGAAKRGEQGQDYRQILSYYFPTTVLGINTAGDTWTRIDGQGLSLYTPRPKQEAAVLDVGDQARREAERRIGFRLANPVRIKVYPSAAAFQRVTGQATALASTSRHTIRLQPLSKLPAGKLSSVLVREMLKVLIYEKGDPGAPRWLRDGLATYLIQPAASPKASRPKAKTDNSARARVQRLIEGNGMEYALAWLALGTPPEAAGK